MSNNNNKKCVPELRFPGFTGDWVEKKLGECFKIGNGRDYKHLSEGEIPVYGSGGYMCSVDSYLFDGDSACIGRKGTINSPTFLQGRFWTVDTLFYTYDFKDTFAYFVYLIFQNIDWMKHNEAGGVPSLSQKIINNIKVSLPPTLAEQQKIAECLSSLDDEISAETEQVEALKEHKKGMMQQLLPSISNEQFAMSNEQLAISNGKCVPKLRFPGFTGDWVEKKLGECFKIGNGRDYKHLSEGEIPVYGSGGYMCSVDSYLFDGDSACIGRKGTINSPTFLQGKFWTVDTLFYTYDFKDTFAYFVYLLFQNIDWMKHNEAGGVPSLSQKIINNIKVSLPPTLAEQEKIAECLSSIDEQIAAQQQKVEALKEHKKGLMQKLFPMSNEQ